MADRELSQSSGRPQDEHTVIPGGLFGTGIDDLAKYRIVQYLQECSDALDGCSISASLGLHPIDLVKEALESLASNGVLVCEGQDPPVYAVNGQSSLRNTLDKLYQPASPQERESIFRALAASSLAKARARARDNGPERKG